MGSLINRQTRSLALPARCRRTCSVSKSVRLLEHHEQDGFLNVQAVFGLIEDNGLGRFHNLISDLLATFGGQAMHKERIGAGEERRHSLT